MFRSLTSSRGPMARLAQRLFHSTPSTMQTPLLPQSILAPPKSYPTTTATCWIDHVLVTFQHPSDITLLELARRNNINIPHFCYNRNLNIAGSCRMCMALRVADRKYVIACSEAVDPNAKYITIDDTIKNIRAFILEFTLANHSLDCPICDQGGECELQDLAEVYGYDTSRYDYSDLKYEPDDMPINFIIKSDMNRCLHCTKCIRFLDAFSDDGKDAELGQMARDPQTICTYRDDNSSASYLHDMLSGNVIEICPVGALTGRDSSCETRPWELARLDAINIFDGSLTAINIEVKEGTEFYRCNASKDPQSPDLLLNNEFITDRAREAPSGNEFKRVTANYSIDVDSRKLILHHALRLFASDPLFRSKALFLIADSIVSPRGGEPIAASGKAAHGHH